MDARISVIVPVFQAKAYLDRCVKSILSSTYPQIELLLIDDGSTDGSGLLCDKWAQKDARIKVFHTLNQGVSCARNTGIQKATGNFVAFVDADDYIAKETFQTALHYFTDDVVSVAYKTILCKADGTAYHTAPVSGETLTFATTKEALEYYWYPGKNTAVWCRLFRRDLLLTNSIFFDASTGFNEEGLFMTRYYLHCTGKVIQLNHRFYYYVLHPESATHHISAKQIQKVMENYHTLIPLLASVSNVCERNIKNRYIDVLISLLRSQYPLTRSKSTSNSKLSADIVREMHHFAVSYLFSGQVPLRRKLYLCSILICPNLSFRIARIAKIYSMTHAKGE